MSPRRCIYLHIIGFTDFIISQSFFPLARHIHFLKYKIIIDNIFDYLIRPSILMELDQACQVLLLPPTHMNSFVLLLPIFHIKYVHYFGNTSFLKVLVKLFFYLCDLVYVLYGNTEIIIMPRKRSKFCRS